jgi:phosphatidylglycerol:prolipoprotein diacylglycerol transferase
MHPELFKIGPIVVRAYGVMLFMSFVVGLFYVRYKAKHKKISPDFVTNLSFLVIFAGIIGARLFYVFYHWSEFSGNLLDIINPFGGGGTIGIAGLNLYGGLIFAIGAGIIYIIIKKAPFLDTLDIFAPPIALGTFFTRIGCFLNGCCFGKQCDLPWGMHFPENSIPYAIFQDQAIHPTQLYMSFYGLALFLVLHYLDRKDHFSGMLFAIFLIVEGFFRFVIEFVRYYEQAMIPNLFGMEMTYNHLVAAILFILGWALFFYLRKRAKQTES